MSEKWTEADVTANKARRAAEKQGEGAITTRAGGSISVLEFLARGIKSASRRKKRAPWPKDLPPQPPFSALGREAEEKVRAALGRAARRAEGG